ncbi:MAG: outer membrane beta-barrel protein [Gemmatimonadales bacterium]
MGKIRAIGFSAFLAVLLAGSASAQQAQTRQGFWIGGGAGYGSMGLSCDGCAPTDRVGAPSAYLALGGTLRQNILVGVETNLWTKSDAGTRLTMTNISGAVYWYPMTTTGLFVKGGAGFSALDSGFGGGTSGFGVLGGVGYDVPVARNLSITPVANWFRGGFSGGSANVLQIGLGVTSH